MSVLSTTLSFALYKLIRIRILKKQTKYNFLLTLTSLHLNIMPSDSITSSPFPKDRHETFYLYSLESLNLQIIYLCLSSFNSQFLCKIDFREFHLFLILTLFTVVENCWMLFTWTYVRFAMYSAIWQVFYFDLITSFKNKFFKA